MLRTIQIVTVLQGLFLLFVLLKRRKDYKKVNFWLLFGCIMSVLLYAIGDDDYNLIAPNTDWFLFHDTLIITFFFLFIRYYRSDREEFDPKDLWFFAPYVLKAVFQALKSQGLVGESMLLAVGKGVSTLAFSAMLFYSIYDILKRKKEKWLLLFIVPLTIIFIVDELGFFITGSHDSPFFLDSYGTILAAVFLFYYVLYKIIVAPRDVLPKSDSSKYRTSSLNVAKITSLKERLRLLMEDEKLFKDSTLTVNDVAQRLDIPRQQLSELLNVHMKVGFQDYINHHRIEAFIQCLQHQDYKNHTLLGIAMEVGFSSKSSFNSTFKKLKGMTPSAYKKQLG